MIKINLLPRERIRRPAMAPRLLVALMFVAVLVATVFTTLYLELRNARIHGQIDEVNVRIEELKPRVAEVEVLQRQIAEARRKEQLLRQIESLRIPWDKVLTELRKIMPADVWLTHIDARGDGILSFEGAGVSYESVARFMVNLNASPVFQNADFGAAQKANLANRKVVNFTVTVQLAPTQKAAAVR